MTSVSESDREAVSRAAANTFNRLLLQDCRTEALEAMRNEGEVALPTAFEALGQAAGQQMFGSPTSLPYLERMQRHLNLGDIEALAREAGIGVPGAAATSGGN